MLLPLVFSCHDLTLAIDLKIDKGKLIRLITWEWSIQPGKSLALGTSSPIELLIVLWDNTLRNIRVIASLMKRFHLFKLQVPLQLIESVECRDIFQLHLTCKDCKVIRYGACLWCYLTYKVFLKNEYGLVIEQLKLSYTSMFLYPDIMTIAFHLPVIYNKILKAKIVQQVGQLLYMKLTWFGSWHPFWHLKSF